VDQPTRQAKSSLIFLLELLQVLDTFRGQKKNALRDSKLIGHDAQPPMYVVTFFFWDYFFVAMGSFLSFFSMEANAIVYFSGS
jgi:hypothetical protein